MAPRPSTLMPPRHATKPVTIDGIISSEATRRRPTDTNRTCTIMTRGWDIMTTTTTTATIPAQTTVATKQSARLVCLSNATAKVVGPGRMKTMKVTTYADRLESDSRSQRRRILCRGASPIWILLVLETVRRSAMRCIPFTIGMLRGFHSVLIYSRAMDAHVNWPEVWRCRFAANQLGSARAAGTALRHFSMTTRKAAAAA
mmetsp:Transcript_29750/g.65494  ORF Transcript_29750/g.65494 Transcript_29750/m.65494 type:complete len:201 (-) Transcript_29750:758-1360(-)